MLIRLNNLLLLLVLLLLVLLPLAPAGASSCDASPSDSSPRGVHLAYSNTSRLPIVFPFVLRTVLDISSNLDLTEDPIWLEPRNRDFRAAHWGKTAHNAFAPESPI